MNFIIQKLKSKHTFLKKYTNWAKLIYFSLVLREQEEKTTKYFAPMYPTFEGIFSLRLCMIASALKRWLSIAEKIAYFTFYDTHSIVYDRWRASFQYNLGCMTLVRSRFRSLMTRKTHFNKCIKHAIFFLSIQRKEFNKLPTP